MKPVNRILAVGVLLLAFVTGGIHVLRTRPAEVPVLVFYKIGEKEDSPWWLPRDAFEEHIAFLDEAGYETILPEDLLAHRRWGKPLPRKPVILTFDGGFVDVLTDVEPVLAERGFRGISFLPTASIHASEPRGEFEDAPCLLWSEIRAMTARGTITFGGYTYRRRNLAVVPEPEKEIERCYQDIVRHAGFEPVAFAYPQGQYRDVTATAVRRSGFSVAFTTGDRVARITRSTDLYTLVRVGVKGGDRNFEAWRDPAREKAEHVYYYVKNHGVAMDVTPRIVADTLNPRDTWLPTERLGGRVGSWRWDAEPRVLDDPSLHLELWDKNRVLRLYKERLPEH